MRVYGPLSHNLVVLIVYYPLYLTVQSLQQKTLVFFYFWNNLFVYVFNVCISNLKHLAVQSWQ